MKKYIQEQMETEDIIIKEYIYKKNGALLGPIISKIYNLQDLLYRGHKKQGRYAPPSSSLFPQ